MKIQLSATTLYSIMEKWVTNEKETDWALKFSNPNKSIIDYELERLRGANEGRGFLYRVIANEEARMHDNQTRDKWNQVREFIVESDIPGEIGTELKSYRV